MRTVIIAAAIMAGASVLSGCVAAPEAGAPTTTPPPSSATPDASTPPASSPPEASELVGIPLALECSALLTPEALYAFNPNVGTDPAYTPTELAQEALDLEGVACGWLNQTSAVTYSVAVAQLAPAGLATLRDRAAATAGSVDLPNADGSFVFGGQGGIEQVFLNEYWVIIESPEFIAAGDAAALVEAVAAALP